jgi:iron complex outermembrane receptor protein
MAIVADVGIIDSSPPPLSCPPHKFRANIAMRLVIDQSITYEEKAKVSSKKCKLFMLNKHRIRMGTGYRNGDVYKVTELKNFTMVIVPGTGAVNLSLPACLTDATGNPDLAFLLQHKRYVAYVYAQDEWNFTNWSAQVAVQNLLNKDARKPAVSPTLPNDLPLSPRVPSTFSHSETSKRNAKATIPVRIFFIK